MDSKISKDMNNNEETHDLLEFLVICFLTVLFVFMFLKLVIL